MLQNLRKDTDSIITMTDGKNGAYCYDGKNIYVCPIYPSTVVSTLGAGDAFASTFAASLDKFDWNIELALKYATINSASVCTHFGAQDGLLSYEQLNEKLNNSLAVKKLDV